MSEPHERNARNVRIAKEFRANGGLHIGDYGDALLLLTTVGAKSGQTRLNPVVYSRDGDRYVVVASHGGSPQSPDWYHNLVARPTATVEVGSETFQVRVIVPDRETRDRLYAAHAEQFPSFLDYQKRTTRVIPVAILERIADA